MEPRRLGHLSPNTQKQQRPDNNGIKGLVFWLLVIGTNPTALLHRRLSRWLLLGVEFPLNPAEFLFGVACNDLILASTLAVGKGYLGLVLPSLGGPACQQRMMFFGRAPAVITLPKALFSWKTAGILTGVKLATLAVVLGLARAGLLPVWFPHWD